MATKAPHHRIPPLSLSASLRLPLINKYLAMADPISVVEVGCGQGAMAYRLASRFDYQGYEPDESSFKVAADRVSDLGLGKVHNTPIPTTPPRRYSALLAFEVLEHIEDDLDALRGWTRWVEKGGAVVISVPAHPHRFGAGDRAVGHYRRYSRQGLIDVMSAAGIDVRVVGSWGMPFGYVLEAARNTLFHRGMSDGSTPERTARSGRLFQPWAQLGRVPEWTMKPFSYFQIPFIATDLGIGYVALGRVPG